MSPKTFIVLARRLWATRKQLDDAYLAYDRPRWQALLRRQAKLEEMVLNYTTEEATA